MPTSTPGGAISRSALFTQPSSSTRVHSPDRPSTRSGADGASVPAGCPSGDLYSTVRRADSTREGSTGAEEALGQLADERARGGGAEVLLRRARYREVIAGTRRRAHGGRENPAFEDDALPVALRLAADEHGPARQPRQALSARLLVEPGAVGRDAKACLGGEGQGCDEPQHNW